LVAYESEVRKLWLGGPGILFRLSKDALPTTSPPESVLTQAV